MAEESPAAERATRIRPATVDDTEAIVGLLDELGYPLEPVSARALIHEHRSHHSSASCCLVGSDTAGSGYWHEFQIAGGGGHVHDGGHDRLLPA